MAQMTDEELKAICGRLAAISNAFQARRLTTKYLDENFMRLFSDACRLRTALSEARADTARIDWLESEARRDPLLLHNYHPGASVSRTSGSYRGLGMLDSRRTIREAIDAASAPSEPAT